MIMMHSSSIARLPDRMVDTETSTTLLSIITRLRSHLHFTPIFKQGIDEVCIFFSLKFSVKTKYNQSHL